MDDEGRAAGDEGTELKARLIALLIGVALFGWILYRADLHAVWSQLRVVHWRFVWILLIYGAILSISTFGWRFAIAPEQRGKVSWGELFRIRLAGQALNVLTPAASLGGEPLKAHRLTQNGISGADATASVVVSKTTYVLGMLLFCVVGLAVALFTRSLPADLLNGIRIALPLLSIVLVLFLLAQFFQPFDRGLRLLQRFFPTAVGRLSPMLQEWDRTIVHFYRERPWSVAASFGSHFAGWMVGALEVYVILQLLGGPASTATALSLEALWVLLKSGAFLIPGAIGASEGVALLVCTGLGIPAAAGLGVALVRRARELLWLGPGLIEAVRWRSAFTSINR